MRNTTLAGTIVLAIIGLFGLSLLAGSLRGTGQAVDNSNILNVMYGDAQPAAEQRSIEVEYPGLIRQPTGAREEILREFYPANDDLMLRTDRFPRKIEGVQN